MMNPAALIAFPLILVHMGVPTTIKLGPSHPVTIRADKAYDLAYAAVEAELPNTPRSDKDIWVLRLWGWSGPESGWQTNAMGDCTDNANRSVSTCRSLGVMQTMDPERWGFTRVEVLADGVIGYRVGLRIMRYAIAKCGGVASGLGMYASGNCGWAQALVKTRCKLIGDECK